MIYPDSPEPDIDLYEYFSFNASFCGDIVECPGSIFGVDDLGDPIFNYGFVGAPREQGIPVHEL